MTSKLKWIYLACNIGHTVRLITAWVFFVSGNKVLLISYRGTLTAAACM